MASSQQQPQQQLTLQLPPSSLLEVGIEASSIGGVCVVISKTNDASPLEVGDIIESINGTSLVDVPGGVLAWMNLIDASEKDTISVVVRRTVKSPVVPDSSSSNHEAEARTNSNEAPLETEGIETTQQHPGSVDLRENSNSGNETSSNANPYSHNSTSSNHEAEAEKIKSNESPLEAEGIGNTQQHPGGVDFQENDSALSNEAEAETNSNEASQDAEGMDNAPSDSEDDTQHQSSANNTTMSKRSPARISSLDIWPPPSIALAKDKADVEFPIDNSSNSSIEIPSIFEESISNNDIDSEGGSAASNTILSAALSSPSKSPQQSVNDPDQSSTATSFSSHDTDETQEAQTAAEQSEVEKLAEFERVERELQQEVEQKKVALKNFLHKVGMDKERKLATTTAVAAAPDTTTGNDVEMIEEGEIRAKEPQPIAQPQVNGDQEERNKPISKPTPDPNGNNAKFILPVLLLLAVAGGLAIALGVIIGRPSNEEKVSVTTSRATDGQVGTAGANPEVKKTDIPSMLPSNTPSNLPSSNTPSDLDSMRPSSGASSSLTAEDIVKIPTTYFPTLGSNSPTKMLRTLRPVAETETSTAESNEVCTENSDCAGGACGYPNFSSESSTVCCESGATTRVYTTSTEWMYPGYRYFCTERPDGTLCGKTDAICSSGACVGGRCASSKLGSGRLCTWNNDCEGGACGYERPSLASSMVCCPSGALVRVYLSNYNEGHLNGWHDVCTDQPEGTLCGETDAICSSDVCVGGKCATSKLGSDKVCTSNNDCVEGACGYEFTDSYYSTVCCKSGDIARVYMSNPDDDWDWGNNWGNNWDNNWDDGWGDNYGARYFCTDQPDGAFCGETDAICSSSACVGRECANSKLGYDEVCTSNNDCEGGACGYANFSSSSTVCCKSGATTSVYVNPSDGWPFSGLSYFCTDQTDGTLCGKADAICSSGLCVAGKCASSKLDANDVCISNDDCRGGHCGFAILSSASSKVCCASEATVLVYLSSLDGWSSSVSSYFCTDQPDGAFCEGTDAVCSSGLCIGGKCASSKLSSNEVCASNDECIEGACGYASMNPALTKVCCASGATARFFSYTQDGWPSSGWRNFCTDQPDGTFCGKASEICSSVACVGGKCMSSKLGPDEVCSSNIDCAEGACGYPSLDLTISEVCCRSGATISFYLTTSDGWPFPGWRFFCTNQPDGTLCGETDEICSSNACVESKCASSKLGSDEVCTSNNDCAGGACGYECMSPASSTVCCASGATTRAYWTSQDDDWDYGWLYSGSRYFCTDQPDGTLCGETDTICSSNACVGGICTMSKLSSNEVCKSSNDCVGGACGYVSMNPASSTVCCASGAVIKAYWSNSDDDWGFSSSFSAATSFCTDQPDGTLCGETDAICSSGLCFRGKCASSKLGSDEYCTSSNDCAEGVCGYASMSPASSTVCCASGATKKVYSPSDGWPLNGWRYVCTDQPDGTLCGKANAICSSDACVEGKCVSTTNLFDDGTTNKTDDVLDESTLLYMLKNLSSDSGVSLDDPLSPQSKAYNWLVEADKSTYENVSDIHVLQRYAMATIYYGLAGDGWVDNDKWLSDAHVCEWELVKYCTGKMVSVLEMYSNNMVGQIPVEITHIRTLEILDLTDNELNGPIPSEFGYLEDLEILRLGGNFLSGTIPLQLGNLISLHELYLHVNEFNASSMPDEICDLRREGGNGLTTLWADCKGEDTGMTHVRCEESCCDECFDIDSEFKFYIGYGSNEPSTEFPTSQPVPGQPPSLNLPPVANESPITEENLILKESLKSHMQDYPILEDRLLDVNSHAYEAFLWLGSSKNLDELSEFQKLQRYGLGTFYLSTSIDVHWKVSTGWKSNAPECSWFGIYCADDSIVTEINLSSNRMSGTIPPEIALSGLGNEISKLNLSGNNIQGNIPKEIGLFKSLEELDLRANDFEGEIPSELGQLTKLKSLQLEANELEGNMPQEICDLRQYDLGMLTADCDAANPFSQVSCDVYSCCTKCS